MKVVVNRCFDGFGLSAKAIRKYLELKGKKCWFYEEVYENDQIKYHRVVEEEDFFLSVTEDLGEYPTDEEMNCAEYFSEYDIERNDSDLVAVVEELGDEANRRFAELEVVEIPDDVEWEISEYDGVERVEEVHRSW